MSFILKCFLDLGSGLGVKKIIINKKNNIVLLILSEGSIAGKCQRIKKKLHI